MPSASASTSLTLATMSAIGDLDAEVVDLVAVVRADDVDEVLADVVHVALDGGDDELALARRAADALHVRLEVGDGRLHRLGRLQHERQLHLAAAEQLADDLHPVEQDVVDDRQRGHAAGQRLVEIGGEALAVAVDDAVLEPLLDRPAVRSSFTAFDALHVGEHLEAAAAAGRSAGSPSRPVGGGRRSGRGRRRAARRGAVRGGTILPAWTIAESRPGLHALVEEHAVQRVAGRRARGRS